MGWEALEEVWDYATRDRGNDIPEQRGRGLNPQRTEAQQNQDALEASGLVRREGEGIVNDVVQAAEFLFPQPTEPRAFHRGVGPEPVANTRQQYANTDEFPFEVLQIGAETSQPITDTEGNPVPWVEGMDHPRINTELGPMVGQEMPGIDPRMAEGMDSFTSATPPADGGEPIRFVRANEAPPDPSGDRPDLYTGTLDPETRRNISRSFEHSADVIQGAQDWSDDLPWYAQLVTGIPRVISEVPEFISDELGGMGRGWNRGAVGAELGALPAGALDVAGVENDFTRAVDEGAMGGELRTDTESQVGGGLLGGLITGAGLAGAAKTAAPILATASPRIAAFMAANPQKIGMVADFAVGYLESRGMTPDQLRDPNMMGIFGGALAAALGLPLRYFAVEGPNRPNAEAPQGPRQWSQRQDALNDPPAGPRQWQPGQEGDAPQAGPRQWAPGESGTIRPAGPEWDLPGTPRHDMMGRRNRELRTPEGRQAAGEPFELGASTPRHDRFGNVGETMDEHGLTEMSQIAGLDEDALRRLAESVQSDPSQLQLPNAGGDQSMRNMFRAGERTGPALREDGTGIYTEGVDAGAEIRERVRLGQLPEDWQAMANRGASDEELTAAFAENLHPRDIDALDPGRRQSVIADDVQEYLVANPEMRRPLQGKFGRVGHIGPNPEDLNRTGAIKTGARTESVYDREFTDAPYLREDFGATPDAAPPAQGEMVFDDYFGPEQEQMSLEDMMAMFGGGDFEDAAGREAVGEMLEGSYRGAPTPPRSARPDDVAPDFGDSEYFDIGDIPGMEREAPPAARPRPEAEDGLEGTEVGQFLDEMEGRAPVPEGPVQPVPDEAAQRALQQLAGNDSPVPTQAAPDAPTQAVTPEQAAAIEATVADVQSRIDAIMADEGMDYANRHAALNRLGVSRDDPAFNPVMEQVIAARRANQASREGAHEGRNIKGWRTLIGVGNRAQNRPSPATGRRIAQEADAFRRQLAEEGLTENQIKKKMSRGTDADPAFWDMVAQREEPYRTFYGQGGRGRSMRRPKEDGVRVPFEDMPETPYERGLADAEVGVPDPNDPNYVEGQELYTGVPQLGENLRAGMDWMRDNYQPEDLTRVTEGPSGVGDETWMGSAADGPVVQRMERFAPLAAGMAVLPTQILGDLSGVPLSGTGAALATYGFASNASNVLRGLDRMVARGRYSDMGKLGALRDMYRQGSAPMQMGRQTQADAPPAAIALYQAMTGDAEFRTEFQAAVEEADAQGDQPEPMSMEDYEAQMGGGAPTGASTGSSEPLTVEEYERMMGAGAQ